MNVIFDQVDKYLGSINNYWTHHEVFILTIGLFLFTILCVIISTSHAYEARLIKAIDMFNNYFIDNPQINENNLVAFNAKMKTKKVPKQLRKQWQQFVLYREGKASEYMSFDNCVATPIRNSSFKRDIVTMNIISYILAAVALLLNFYIFGGEAAKKTETIIIDFLPQILLAPVIILLLNFIITIFLDLRHNAIVSDLYSNYQYFEVNIDKATQSLPEYVDYEVLFDKNEIKKGIPILYAYLQKRAEEEQRELERARLRNVEHEKFSFDASGVESSLVLDRAMQEAENYIAERKKYMQDMQQINSEINQEDINFREITKEYQRQMQVSKESFDNYKSQLNEASSTIESNYLKKQQQQELDRQRNLERDYDTSSDRHKKVIESYQAELTTIEGFIAEARKNLERVMMSEFETYSNKVYDAASKVVEEREQEKTDELHNKIQNLEEELSAKSKELEYLYGQNQILTEKFDQQANEYQQKLDRNKQILSKVSDEISKYNQTDSTMDNAHEALTAQPEYQDVQEEYAEPVYEEYAEQPQDYGYDYQEPSEQSEDLSFDYSPYQEQEVQNSEEEMNFNYSPYEEQVEETFDYSPYQEEPVQASEPEQEDISFNYSPYEEETSNDEDEPLSFNYSPYEEEVKEEQIEEPAITKIRWLDDEDDDKSNSGMEADSTEAKIESIVPKRKAGRPRKVQVEKPAEPKRRGRPKKVETQKVEEVQSKRKAGRPRKETSEVKPVKKGRGRPKKVESASVVSKSKAEKTEVKSANRGRGRPKKVEAKTTVEAKPVKKGRGRPKKVETKSTVEVKPVKKGRGRPKKVESAPVLVKKGRGRPRKIEAVEPVDKIEDIDAYLKEINEEIAKENAKIAESAKALEKKTKLTKKK